MKFYKKVVEKNFFDIDDELKNNFFRTIIIFLEFFPYNNYNMQKLKGGDRMGVGRPKLLNPQSKRFEMRLTDSEFQKIETVSKKLKISKREAVLQGIDLLIHHRPKRIASRSIKEILKERGVDVSDMD